MAGTRGDQKVRPRQGRGARQCAGRAAVEEEPAVQTVRHSAGVRRARVRQSAGARCARVRQSAGVRCARVSQSAGARCATVSQSARVRPGGSRLSALTRQACELDDIHEHDGARGRELLVRESAGVGSELDHVVPPRPKQLRHVRVHAAAAQGQRHVLRGSPESRVVSQRSTSRQRWGAVGRLGRSHRN